MNMPDNQFQSLTGELERNDRALTGYEQTARQLALMRVMDLVRSLNPMSVQFQTLNNWLHCQLLLITLVPEATL